MSKYFMSYFTNEQECLKALIGIHNNGNDIECDPMYFKGNFWKDGLNKPKYKFDIKPQVQECSYGDATNLPLQDNSINSMILDPPFMICTRKSQLGYYSSKTHSFYNSFESLEKGYKGILANAYRILKKNGLLIFKCQDYTDSKTTMTHCYVWKWATELGFYADDLAILNIPQSKIYNGNLKQKHLRKVHTYFWVFKKRGK